MMPAKKAKKAKKKTSRARAKGFKLVPKAATRELLIRGRPPLNLTVEFDGAELVIRIPKGGRC